jgi:hypothetical protein
MLARLFGLFATVHPVLVGGRGLAAVSGATSRVLVSISPPSSSRPRQQGAGGARLWPARGCCSAGVGAQGVARPAGADGVPAPPDDAGESRRHRRGRTAGWAWSVTLAAIISWVLLTRPSVKASLPLTAISLRLYADVDNKEEGDRSTVALFFC